MSWLKEYGFSVGGVLVAAFIAAQTGFNLGVEARISANAPQAEVAATEAASTAPRINPHID